MTPGKLTYEEVMDFLHYADKLAADPPQWLKEASPDLSRALIDSKYLEKVMPAILLVMATQGPAMILPSIWITAFTMGVEFERRKKELETLSRL